MATPRGLRLSPQTSSPDLARLQRELDREIREVEKKIDGDADELAARVTAIEGYIADDLVPYLEALQTFVAYGTSPPEPPW